jgi:hypothetical protein
MRKPATSGLSQVPDKPGYFSSDQKMTKVRQGAFRGASVAVPGHSSTELSTSTVDKENFRLR